MIFKAVGIFRCDMLSIEFKKSKNEIINFFTIGNFMQVCWEMVSIDLYLHIIFILILQMNSFQFEYLIIVPSSIFVNYNPLHDKD